MQLVKSLVYQRWTISPAGEIRTIQPKLDEKMLGKQTNKNCRCTKHISCIIQYYPAPSVYVVKILQDIYFLIHNLWISDLTSHVGIKATHQLPSRLLRWEQCDDLCPSSQGWRWWAGVTGGLSEWNNVRQTPPFAGFVHREGAKGPRRLAAFRSQNGKKNGLSHIDSMNTAFWIPRSPVRSLSEVLPSDCRIITSCCLKPWRSGLQRWLHW